MKNIKEKEKKRLVIQSQIDNQKDRLERNRLGQFATPTDLALDILRYAKKLFRKDSPIRFFDPAFGTGTFYSALLNVFPTDRISAAKGCEIDPDYGEAAKRLWQSTPIEINVEDFTFANPPHENHRKFNLIICNPPYVRHHHILNDEKPRLRAKTRLASAMMLPGLSGLYCYFMGLSHEWLQNEGIAGWLVPSEFMYVNYGDALKQYLLDQVTLLHVHRFNPTEVQFEDALVSSAIVWFRKSRPPAQHDVLFTYGGTLAKPHTSRLVGTKILRLESKWNRFPEKPERAAPKQLMLGDLFDIKRGLATGDNNFFILPKEDILAKDLSLEQFVPILPSPRKLHVNSVQADTEGVPELYPQLYLLNCNLPEDELKVKHPHLWAYLQEGRARGVADRYLCRNRTPWYSQETRLPSMFFCTYIGRSVKDRGPFRFILNRSKATVTNSYLVLYPKSNLAAAFRKKPGLVDKVWSALNEIPPGSMIEEGRVYGGGLYKVEPKELSKVSIHSLLPVFQELEQSDRQLTILPTLLQPAHRFL